MQTTKPMTTKVSYCKHGVSLHVKGHDCEYTDLRDSIVPKAERYADAQIGARPEKQHGAGGGKEALNPAYEAWARAWNRCFLNYIDTAVRTMLKERP